MPLSNEPEPELGAGMPIHTDPVEALEDLLSFGTARLAVPSLVYRPVPPEQWSEAFSYGGSFFEERKLPGTYDPERSLRIWQRVSVDTLNVMLGAYRGEVLVGGIGVAVLMDEHSDHVYASEAFFFVAPHCRRGRLGLQLLDAAEAWVRERGVKDFRIAAFHADDFESMAKMYGRKGYAPFLTHFRKEL